ncbi:NB-ARC domain-containing protein [Lentzea waywayandensis]|uniref:NB-ARC domain-containing protein n=1 Tax=Lentzea waywayandensis TaxID=84724 RepID=A0A1I6F565_9PSEU|nr:NB-ARC domain-containing protein [Lentzea waywayandensis]SFR25040.1 NB-ARC domain-containing protein [Lentzea waywayandensis]
MGDVRFLLLGPLRVQVDGHEVPLPAGRGRTILATLLANAGEIVPLDDLGDASSTRKAVSRLRHALGEAASCLRTHGTGYLVHVTNSDLRDFRSLRDQGRHAEALTLWRGKAFEDVGGVHDAAARLDAEREAVQALVPVPRQLPGMLAQFAGRDRELAALTEPAPVTVVSGTAGIGKTALAVQWCNEAASRFPDGQLHVNLRGFDPAFEPMRPEYALRGFLGMLGVPAARMPAGHDDQVALYRRLVAARNLVVLLDNARDAAQVRPLLPGHDGCAVVITSRNRMRDLDGARVLDLDVLTDTEAVGLLTERVGAGPVTAEPAAVTRLITLCGGLPLALSIVGARAATDPHLSLGALADELANEQNTLDFLDTGDPTTSVRAAFSLSCTRLSTAAATLFRLLGVHPGPDISAAAATSLAGSDAGTALLELARANLVTNSKDRYELHDLVRAYARELAGQVETRAALHRAVDHYLHSAHHADSLLGEDRRHFTIAAAQPGVSPELVADEEQAWQWFETENQVLIAMSALAAAERFDVQAWQLPWCLHLYFDREARWREWNALLTTALQAAQRLGDDDAVARMHHLVAHTWFRFTDFDRCTAHLRSALKIYEQQGNKSGAARVHRSISTVFERQGSLEASTHHIRLAMALFTEVDDRMGLANAMGDLGWYLGVLGHHEEALRTCRDARDLHREHGNRFAEAETLDSIAYNLRALGDLTGAAHHYDLSVAAARASGNRYGIAVTLVSLGEVHEEMGDGQAAHRAWTEALQTFEDLGQPDADAVRAKLTALSAASSSG